MFKTSYTVNKGCGARIPEIREFQQNSNSYLDKYLKPLSHVRVCTHEQMSIRTL